MQLYTLYTLTVDKYNQIHPALRAGRGGFLWFAALAATPTGCSERLFAREKKCEAEFLCTHFTIVVKRHHKRDVVTSASRSWL